MNGKVSVPHSGREIVLPREVRQTAPCNRQRNGLDATFPSRLRYRQLAGRDRMREEEPQRRDDAVHRRHRDTGLLLLDLEPAEILRHRGVR